MTNPLSEELAIAGLQMAEADPLIDETSTSVEVRETVVRLRGGKTAGVCCNSTGLF